MIRGFEEQFEKTTIRRIQSLLDRISKIHFAGCAASQYYKVDLDLCLRAGALLGSLQVSASLLEIVVRELEIDRISKDNRSQEAIFVNPQRELEANRSKGFKIIVNNLRDAGLFNSGDAERAIQFYDCVRVPVHHGLPLRFVEKNTQQLEEAKLLAEIFGSNLNDIGVGMHDFERAIEDHSLNLIETAISLIEKIVK
jgi:hypothetical protein